MSFRLVADLGVITAMPDYVPETRLRDFRTLYEAEFYVFEKRIDDANFAKVTDKLSPGQKIHGEIFELSGEVYEKQLKFLQEKGALRVGAQGISLAWEQKRTSFPKDHWYTIYSPDEKDRLPETKDGYEPGSVFIPSMRIMPSKKMVKFFLHKSWAGSSKDALLCCTPA